METSAKHVTQDHVNSLHLMAFTTLLAVPLHSQTNVLLFKILNCPVQPHINWLIHLFLHLPRTSHQRFDVSFYNTLSHIFRLNCSLHPTWEIISSNLASIENSFTNGSVFASTNLEADLTVPGLMNQVTWRENLIRARITLHNFL